MSFFLVVYLSTHSQYGLITQITTPSVLNNMNTEHIICGLQEQCKLIPPPPSPPFSSEIYTISSSNKCCWSTGEIHFYSECPETGLRSSRTSLSHFRKSHRSCRNDAACESILVITAAVEWGACPTKWSKSASVTVLGGWKWRNLEFSMNSVGWIWHVRENRIIKMKRKKQRPLFLNKNNFQTIWLEWWKSWVNPL